LFDGEERCLVLSLFFQRETGIVCVCGEMSVGFCLDGGERVSLLSGEMSVGFCLGCGERVLLLFLLWCLGASIILVRGDQRLLLLGWWRASIILVGGDQRLFLGLGASIIHQRLLSGVWIENGVFLGGIARRFVFEIPMVALEQGR
jgi:hypothetical protein